MIIVKRNYQFHKTFFAFLDNTVFKTKAKLRIVPDANGDNHYEIVSMTIDVAVGPGKLKMISPPKQKNLG